MTDSRTRICFTVDSPYAGGAERYIMLIVRGLDRSRFEPVVLAAELPGLDTWCGELEARGVAVMRFPVGVPFRPWRALPIWRMLSRIAAHVVHVNMPGPYDAQMGTLAPIARLAGARAVVVTEHLPMVERLWKRAALKRVAFRWVDRVLTICEANVPFLVERQLVPVERITVIYNGVPDVRPPPDREEARRRFEVPASARVILFMGSLIARKGVAELVDAVGGVDRPEWKLLIAGTGEDEAGFRRQAQASAAAQRIDFLGWLPDEDIPELLAAADVLVVPSFMEGMPYVILEAMAASVPVIASRINGIPEAVIDGVTGVLVPPGDRAALRDAIATLLGDEERRKRLGKAGRKRFEAHFSLERHLSAMQEFYLDLMDNRRPGKEHIA